MEKDGRDRGSIKYNYMEGDRDEKEPCPAECGLHRQTLDTRLEPSSVPSTYVRWPHFPH